jgi:tetratricopeptide (TPR) repeat protein
MRRVVILGGFLALGFAPAGRLDGQVVDRARAESEAAGQAAEADRLFQRGDWEPAMAIYEAERASRAALGDVRYEAYALRAIGVCRAEMGDDEGAIESWTRARVLDLKRDDQGYAGYDDFLIARAQLRLNRVGEGVASLERALPRLSKAVDRDHEADARLVLTRTLVGLGRSEAARPHVARALALAEKLDDAWRRADAWASSGQVEGALGNPSLALERFSDARELFEQQGRAGDAAWMETVSGSTLILLGRPDLALARYEEAARLHEHLEDGGSLSEDLAAIAGLHLEAGRVEPALAAARKAVEQARDADDREREVEARVRLAQVQARQNDWAAAAETLDEAVGLVRQVARDDSAEQIRILLTAAQADRRAGRELRALARLEAAGKLANESGHAPLRQAVADARRGLPDK